MKRELTASEILYNLSFENRSLPTRSFDLVDYEKVYEVVKQALTTNKQGFNVYLIDDFYKDKLHHLMEFISNLLKDKPKPKDICYVAYEFDKYPKPLYVKNGYGKILKEHIEEIQEEYYEIIYKFYNSSVSEKKETILSDLSKERSEQIRKLLDSAKEEGFDMKPTNNGFAFIPLKEGEAMTEKDYEVLESENKDMIIDKVTKLKLEAEEVLEVLKKVEADSLENLKEILENYLNVEKKLIKAKYDKIFKEDSVCIEYLNFYCDHLQSKIVDNFTSSFDEDEEKINEIVYNPVINLILDNSLNPHPVVLFEEDPTLSNLLGTIEYESHNGSYSTDITLIKSGSLLKANEGCLILRMRDLVNNPGVYYYLKKALLNEKMDVENNKGYLEIIPIGGLKPEAIDINVKVIIIGEYEYFDILYSMDEDFKKIFKMKAEYKPIVDINDKSKNALVKSINQVIENNQLYNISEKAIMETAKILSRKAENKKKFYFDYYEIEKTILLAHNRAKGENREFIEVEDILIANATEDLIYEDLYEMYRDKKILFEVRGQRVGSINGLSVIDLGYFKFGKPLRITCICNKGEGNIIDLQKESNLSGKIHHKSINILRSYLNNFIDPYNRLPVDFYLSFEQTYGKIDGDSASVAEIVSIISSLSKIPIKQNIAVTGSINQFGEVQPIGGVNEKIEGFFNICKELGDSENKGVLIPESNKEDLILNNEVEEAISKGKFHIYTMTSVEDALEILLGKEDITSKDIFDTINIEIKKYDKKAKK